MRIYKNNLQKVVNQSGFALPTVLIASMVMLGALTFAAVSSSTVRTSLDEQYYNQLAQTAADAGVEYAKACLGDETVPSWSADSPLRPGSDCNGDQLSGFACSDSSTDSRCFVVSPSLVEVLVVGGGGGGGGAMGGGGGAGGLLYSASMAVNAQTYTATVGAGGSGGVGSHLGTNGNQSSFNTLSALGGGGGGYYPGNTYHGKDGGSGGGGGGWQSGAGGAGTANQGTNGGAGNSNYLAGGGGGAGVVGQAGQSQVAGYGGNGLQYSISGTATYYAGGGGGGGYWGITCTGGAGGLGGGGGGNCASSGPGTAGTINTGGGGGGAGYSGGGGGTGGSGVVIVRYPSGSMVATGGNITYADSNGLNSRTVTPYPGGYTIHTFTTVGSGAFIVTSVNSGNNIISSIISSFSVGLSQVDSSGNVNISSTGTVNLLRASDNGVWRSYGQTAQVSLINPPIEPPVNPTIQVLVVAGGGDGGGTTTYRSAGGGGGGGVVYDDLYSISNQVYSVTVGAGGHKDAYGDGGNGSSSIFGTLIATGGGAGGGGDSRNQAYEGGSGGGGGIWYSAGAAGTYGQGSNGGNGYRGSDGDESNGAGGGGGAGGAGGNALSDTTGGNGGAGIQNHITGSAIGQNSGGLYYLAGGGGGSTEYLMSVGGAGGIGGGGAGGGGGAAGGGGVDNTGGGGGGDGSGGGSGVVIIRYLSGGIVATGGNITYVDSNGLNSRPITPYPGGYTIHTFTSNGEFNVFDSNWLTIGTQVWAKTNLNVGTRIAGATNQTNNGGTNTVEKYCYGDTDAGCTNTDLNGIAYGGLYQWDEAMQYVTTAGAQGICPVGSHIPSDNDWKILEVQLGMTQEQAGGSGWRGTNQGAQLKSGGSSSLNIPLAGYRNTVGSVYNQSSEGDLWSSSAESSTSAWDRGLGLSDARVGRGGGDKVTGFSVRCLGN